MSMTFVGHEKSDARANSTDSCIVGSTPAGKCHGGRGVLPDKGGRIVAYQVSRERSTTVPEKAVEERITGWSVERVVKPSDEISYAVPVYTLSQDISEENHKTGQKTVGSIESHVSAEPHQVLLHGQVIRGASRIER